MSNYKRYYLLRKDIIRRKYYFKFEQIRLILKFLKLNKFRLISNNFIRFIDPLQNLFNIQINFSNSLKLSTIRNKCIITGRSRSVYKDFRLSRMQLRHLASFGLLMGIKKSSW